MDKGGFGVGRGRDGNDIITSLIYEILKKIKF